MPRQEADLGTTGRTSLPKNTEHDESDGPFAEDQVAEVLLDHARWVGSDLAQRIDTMTQRAAVLLGASLTLVTLWFGILLVAAADHPMTLLIGLAATLLAYGIPIGCSLSGLSPRTYHSVGAASITRYVPGAGRPPAEQWPDIFNQLLHDLVHESAVGESSVLHGMEHDIDRKAQCLRIVQITLVVATVVAPISAVVAYLVRSTS